MVRIPEERVPRFRIGYSRSQPISICATRSHKLDCLVLDIDVLQNVSISISRSPNGRITSIPVVASFLLPLP